MTEWKEYKLGEVIKTNVESIGKDYPYSKILYLDTGSITRNNIDQYQEFELDKAPSRAKRLVKQDDIIYSSVRPNQLHYGYITNPANNLVVSTGFVTITCNKAYIEPKFLYYYLTQENITEYLHSVAEASTSAYPSLKPSDIEFLDISLPPLPEQIRIASILSSLDDKIDLLHRENKTLEAMAETLFRQWFIEDAKEDWKEVLLEDIAYLSAGGDKPKNVSSNRTNELNIPIYSNGIEDEGLYGYTDIPKITEESVTISARGTIGYVVLRTEPFVPIVRLITLTPKKNITSKYLYFWAKSQDINGTGTTQQQLTIPDFKLTKVLLPEKELISKFTNEVDKYYEKILLNKQQIQTLTQQRDGLLPKLMSGEVKI